METEVFVATITRGPGGLGFNIKGGRGHPIPILISRIAPESPLANQRGADIGAEILEVNGINVENATHAEAVSLLKQDGPLTLMLRPNEHWKSASLCCLLILVDHPYMLPSCLLNPARAPVSALDCSR
jgi:C-terminal processing protease CtpA/Prc